MIKKLVKKVINAAGYNVVKISSKSRLPNSRPSHPQYTVISPLQHNTRENMNSYFSDPDNLQKYINGRQEFYETLVSKIYKGISLDGKTKICDVGCGPGDLISLLGSRINNCELFGLDHSDRLIEICRKRFPHIMFKQFNLFEDYESLRNEYDLVICSEVVEHLVEAKLAVKHLFALVQNSGTLVLTVPEGRRDSYMGHINFWSPESWNQFIKEVALEIDAYNFKTDSFWVKNLEYNFATISK